MATKSLNFWAKFKPLFTLFGQVEANRRETLFVAQNGRMMDFAERLAQERRARLAAQRLLEQKSRELFAANEKLGIHARALSEQIVQQRNAVRTAISEAETLKGQAGRFVEDLDRAHTAAVMAERRLWDSINTIDDGFAVYDAQQQLVAANRAYLDMFDAGTVEPGISLSQVLSLLASQGRLDLQGVDPAQWQAQMAQRWERDAIEPLTLQFTNGTWLRLVDRRARDGDMVSLVVDITDQMRIWAAIEAIPDGFVMFDREERLVTCNQRYRDIYADSAPIMEVGVKFEDLLRYGMAKGAHPAATGREADWISQRLHHHRNPGAIFEEQLADGRWIREQDHPTPDGGRVGLRVDITREKSQQAALEAARLQAEAANRAKSAFLANMSHEIRTPMNGVVGMAELLCDTTLNDDQRLFAETIRSSGEALLVIINDILDYSKIEAERLTLHPEPFDLERTIHEIAMLLQPRAREKGIDLLIDFDMFLPTRYVGDPGRLRQVLTNLMGNAVKFTDKGHVLVRVVGVESAPAQQQLHISVEDTGIGIAPENLDAIFGEFNQVETQASRKFEGTGLGLAITQRLIERMDGAVWVDSEFGKGSCFGFRLTLPVAEDTAPAPAPITIRRILAVDDQFINRTILERQLAPCGIDVTLCRSASDALAALGRASFDVILTDYEMPEMNGLQLTCAVRALGVETPIILLTSNPANAREEDGYQHLASVVQKPILRADLYRRLKALESVPEIAPPAPIAPPAARVMRVLVAEDNRTNQLVFQKMVREAQIELQFANTGIEAVEMYQSFTPDLIFMDISMPEMDGRDAARAIRSIEGANSHVPIVALTAHAMDGDETSILAAGIDKYMTKPLRKALILDTITHHAPAHVFAIIAQNHSAA
jgi:signal transduction histidine kinase/DNA-binding response OmpR family regulator